MHLRTQHRIVAMLRVYRKIMIDFVGNMNLHIKHLVFFFSRPDSSFMWFLNPLKSIRYIIWHNHKWTILKIIFIIFFSLFLAMFFYALPGYTIKKMIGA